MHVQQASDVGTNKIKIGGFALPTVLIASLVMLTVLLVSVSSTTAVSTSIKSQYYGTLASSAAEAGLAYAKACMDGNAGVAAWSDANPLTPKTNCSGVSQPSNPDTVMSGTNIRSSFSVGAPTVSGDSRTVRSLGTVSLLRASNQAVWRTYQQVRSASSQTAANTPILNFDQVSTGFTHSCGISAGKVYCWGENVYGQLGNNSTTQSLVPVAVNTSGVLSGRTVTSITTGATYSCAVANGAIFCWGDNTYGQLGNNSTTQSLVPVAVNTAGVLAGRTVTSITSGTYHVCVVANGAAFCWGFNGQGRLGDNSTTQRLVPVAVNTAGVLAGRTVTSIAAVVNSAHTCAVANGAAFCWGYNATGQLGNNTTTQSLVPVAVFTSGILSGRTIDQVAVGADHSCALGGGTPYCWGANSNGQVGDNSTTQRLVPVQVLTTGTPLAGRIVTKITSGLANTCVIGNGAAFCWGLNANGQLGNNSTTQSLVPVAVDTTGVLSGKTVTFLDSHGNSSCAIANGTTYCWGNNATGQIGDNSTTTRLTPVATNTSNLTINAQMTKISVGAAHTCGISYGRAYCWGTGGNGRLGNNSTAQSNTPVAVDTSGALAGKTVTDISVGNGHSCAIANGAAFCWGYNGNGQLGNNSIVDSSVPVAVTATGVLSGRTVTTLVAGSSNGTCAIANGAAFCWGDNSSGQVGDNSTTQRLVPVAVNVAGVLSGRIITAISMSTSTCVAANGAAYCWGNGVSGQLGNSASVSSNVPVAVTATGVLSGRTVTAVAAYTGNCAIANGAAYCWGFNSNGQLGNNSTTLSNVPVAVNAAGVLSGRSVTSISAGQHSCAVANGAAFCWGLNSSGQVGDNSTTQRLVPVAVNAAGVLSGRSVMSISVQGLNSCATANGLPFCWGSNISGQLGNNSTTNSPTPVATDTSGLLPFVLVVPGFYVLY